MSALDLASKIIKEFEGTSLAAYQDQGGIWTVGFGCTHGVSKGMTITQEQAEERLKYDLQDTLNRVQAQVDVPLTDNQLAALLSFTFNEGAGHLHESTVLAKLNQKDYACAADAFLLWDKCRGSVVSGLLRRRQAERELFLSSSPS
jgi:lysozyme